MLRTFQMTLVFLVYEISLVIIYTMQYILLDRFQHKGDRHNFLVNFPRKINQKKIMVNGLKNCFTSYDFKSLTNL